MMITVALSLVVLVVQTALAAFVAARAWSYRPSRLFVYIAAATVVAIGAAVVRDSAPSPEAAYGPLAVLVISISVYASLLLLLVSALFMPEWWEGRRPIIWISLPYVLSVGAIAADLVGRLGIFVDGVRFEQIYRLNAVQPGVVILSVLSLVGQLVVLAVVCRAYVRPEQRGNRGVIAVLGAALAFSLVLAVLIGSFTVLARIASLIQTLPVLLALGYAILGTRLFTPTRAALDLALEALREAVAVTDGDGTVTYVNPSAAALGISPGRPLADQVAASNGGAALRDLMACEGGDFGVRIGERHLELAVAPVRDGGGARRGTLVLARDVTEVAQRSTQLERERARLAATVEQLELARQQREALAQTVRALSLPLMPVLPGVLVLPVVGDFSGARIDEFVAVLLEGVERQRADTVLIDITGLSLLDTDGAQGLMRGVRAAGLLGARCVLVGVRPEVAQSLVALGLSLDEVITAPTLEQAVTARLVRRAGARN